MLHQIKFTCLVKPKSLITMLLLAAMFCFSVLTFAQAAKPRHKTLSHKRVVFAVRFPAPVNASTKKAVQGFFDQLRKKIKYSATDRINKAQGDVNVTFLVNKKHKVAGIQMVKSHRESFNQEVASALFATPFPASAKAGAIYFMIFHFKPSGVKSHKPRDKNSLRTLYRSVKVRADKPYYNLGAIDITDHL